MFLSWHDLSFLLASKLVSSQTPSPSAAEHLRFPLYSMFGAESMRKAQLLPLGKALMLVLKQPGDDIRAAALGDLDGDQ